MPGPIRLIVCGASGRVGSKVIELARADARFKLAGAVAHKRPVDGVPYFGLYQLADLKGAADVWVDFSLPQATARLAAAASDAGAALVTGVTGLGPAQKGALKKAARRVPVFHAPNMSLGMNVLFHLARVASRLLPGYDAAIVEAHHKAKRDAPSGSALRLASAMGSPPVLAVRAGGIVGEHTALWAGPHDRVELTHRAQSREVFAQGALEAAAWLRGRAPGLYGFSDLLGLAS